MASNVSAEQIAKPSNAAKSMNAAALEKKPWRGSWANEVSQAESNEHNHDNVKGKNDSSSSDDREISLEFIDEINEQKFERLVKEEKIKTALKRRHSGSNGDSSCSNSPTSSLTAAAEPKEENKKEKRFRQNSGTSSSPTFVETDPGILARRQKQIDYGKNTVAYDRYTQAVPRSERTREHPRTPNKYGTYSRRAFDGLIKIWRKQLHYYDPPNNASEGANDASASSDSDSD